ncbi:MAG: phosphoribosylaminoimidazolesuccinocarboxamide synthase [Myxococcota bacterium]
MQRGPMLYQGKSKRVYATDDPSRVVLEFTDSATAFNAKKRAEVGDKGRINCAISTHLLNLVGAAGITHHQIATLGPTEVLCHKVEIVPVEVVVRNKVAGSFAKRYAVAEGTALAEPLVELFYKSDALDDPLVTADAAVLLGWAKRWELAFLTETALAINGVLREFWDGLGIELIDAKYEFGRLDGRLVLADEITPDGARLWEKGTGRRLDKDVFRKDLGDLGDTYRALYARLFPAGG